jgi:hypothetical protein
MITALSSALQRYCETRNPNPPRHLGTRYDESGTFLREPGNTVVCHLVEGSASQRAVVDARQRLLEMPQASQFAFTPISSLHMTLFQGIIEHRRKVPYWPQDVAFDTEIHCMTDLYLERFQSFAALEPFRVCVNEVTPTGLTVEGLAADDRRMMQAWRDALADVFGYRHPDHDSYVFHITFCYPIRWLDEAALPVWQIMLDTALDALRRTAPVIELTPPALCSFEDMNHFEERLVFNRAT